MTFNEKIFPESDFPYQILKDWKDQGNAIVFTNGCFDLIHRGHIQYLAKASELGDKLVVGLNSDVSIKRIKGNQRPVKDELNRSEIVAALEFVDLVVIFENDTPLSLIEKVEPDVLVKGGDWSVENIVGSEWVLGKGGRVQTIDYVEGESSSAIIKRIKKMN